MKMPLGTVVDLGPGHIVLDGDPAPLERGTAPRPLFGPCLLWTRSPISATAELLFFLDMGTARRSLMCEGKTFHSTDAHNAWLRPNSITLSDMRPASDMDSVMEFGLSGAIQLASRSVTSSRAGHRPGFQAIITYLVSELSPHVDSSNLVADRFTAGLRPAGELVADQL